ncbi:MULTISPECIES: hypothetical protein [unclassified Arthrobacter]|jgi:hypothetical protein|nr:MULTISPECIES: hypothetical protein [unclassified Arthrobacter]BCW54430.1 hypothetical protein StoSoilB19_18040 [Arthrobacter sp. StoSoilB19]
MGVAELQRIPTAKIAAAAGVAETTIGYHITAATKLAPRLRDVSY